MQAVMRWQHAHLFELRHGDRIYGEPNPDDGALGRKVHKARNLRLKQLIDGSVKGFPYVYDSAATGGKTSSSWASATAAPISTRRIRHLGT